MGPGGVKGGAVTSSSLGFRLSPFLSLGFHPVSKLTLPICETEIGEAERGGVECREFAIRGRSGSGGSSHDFAALRALLAGR